MQLTTREAVKLSLYSMSDTYSVLVGQPEQKKEIMEAMQLLCEHYGFKLEQFFDTEAVE